MSIALIGHTGFVGSNLLKQAHFDAVYNSQNIESIQGTCHDLIFCAGAPGTKWRANAEPEKDLATIMRLIRNLKAVETNQFVLISTVDVYLHPINVNEESIPIIDDLPPYGAHRRMLEEFVESQFSSTIVRLPGLFGPGLRKNAIYDLLNNRLEYCNPRDIIQYYNTNHLYNDILKTLDFGINLINIVTEPVNVRLVARKVFGINFDDDLTKDYAHYDVRTKYARLWNKIGEYLYSKEEVLHDLKDFVGR
ncbi:MAG: NAD-dependent epimerase/dehydratase family protein [Candidatus Hodarchaeota archaeon]